MLPTSFCYWNILWNIFEQEQTEISFDACNAVFHWSHLVNNNDFLYQKIICSFYRSSHMTKYLFSSSSTVSTTSTLRLIQFVWVVEGINFESAKVQNALVKELKSLLCPKLSQRCTCQTDEVPVACVFVPSCHPSASCPTRFMCCRFLVCWGCKRSWLLVDIVFQGAGMWDSWVHGRLHCSARLCKEHSSIDNM